VGKGGGGWMSASRVGMFVCGRGGRDEWMVM